MQPKEEESRDSYYMTLRVFVFRKCFMQSKTEHHVFTQN
jgi:hypothetical protein